MRGRKRLPEKLKILKGTNDPSRNPKSIDENRDTVMKPPGFLSCRAVEIFNELYLIIESQGYSDNSHSRMLALAATTLEEVEILTKALEGKTLAYQTPSTQGQPVWKSRPETKMRADAIRRAASLLSEFGLSASSMSKVSRDTDKPAFNPFADFI